MHSSLFGRAFTWRDFYWWLEDCWTSWDKIWELLVCCLLCRTVWKMRWLNRLFLIVNERLIYYSLTVYVQVAVFIFSFRFSNEIVPSEIKFGQSGPFSSCQAYKTEDMLWSFTLSGPPYTSGFALDQQRSLETFVSAWAPSTQTWLHIKTISLPSHGINSYTGANS